MGEHKRPKEPPHTLGDGPIEDAYIAQMNAIAHVLDETFNGEAKGKDRKTGFVLLVFPFNELEPDGRGRSNFISNGADRKDIAALFREMIARFEGMPTGEGRG